MRKVTFGGASSLDNMFARKDDSVDWLMWSNEAQTMMTEYWKTVDIILMGRKTYEAGLKLSKGKNNPYGGIKSYVFSHTLKPGKRQGVEFVQNDAVEFVKNLKADEGGDICLMGGGNFAKTLFEANLIDEIGFNIHPILLGSGIPIFYEMKQQVDLELLTCQRFKNGCVAVTYRVKH